MPCVYILVYIGEDILEHTNAKCHMCTLQSTCGPLGNIGIIPHNNIIKHTHAKILVTTLERQVSQGDTYGDVVDHSVTYHTPQNRASDIKWCTCTDAKIRTNYPKMAWFASWRIYVYTSRHNCGIGNQHLHHKIPCNSDEVEVYFPHKILVNFVAS